MSVTIGEAQNGHSLACRSASNSISAPQFGHCAMRISSISACGTVAALDRAQVELGDRAAVLGDRLLVAAVPALQLVEVGA